MKCMHKLFIMMMLANSMLFSLSEEKINNIYTQAIDLRYQGDYAKSRFLLESLYIDGVTNEYVLTVLSDVYFDYIADLVNKNQATIIRTAYPGIRTNLEKIWNLYPNSEQIQNNTLRISWGLGDIEFSTQMSRKAIQSNFNHMIANYFMGLYYLKESNLVFAYPYFVHVAFSEITPDNQMLLFQAKEYAGDIAYTQQNYEKALEYYISASEIAVDSKLMIKISMTYAQQQKFKKAIHYMQKISLSELNAEFFDVYVALLYFANTPSSNRVLNVLLSTNQKLPPFANAVAFSKLGQTQKALRFLSQAEFVKTELPWVYHQFNIELLKRFDSLEEQIPSFAAIAQQLYAQKQYDQAWDMILQIEQLQMDQKVNEYEILMNFANIAMSVHEYKKAADYYQKALLLTDDKLSVYANLLDAYIALKEYEKADEILNQFPYNNEMMKAYFYFAQKKYHQAEQCITKIIDQNSNNVLFLNFAAMLYVELENFSMAEKFLLQAYDQHPLSLPTLNHLAYLYAMQKKNLDDALRFAQEAVSMDDDIAYLDTLAWVYVQRGEYSEAGDIFQIIEEQLNNFPNNQLIEIYEHLVFYYQNIGNVEKATAYQNLLP